MATPKTKLGCRYCEHEPKPGWIETDNNGPIVSRPICNNDAADDILDRVEANRAADHIDGYDRDDLGESSDFCLWQTA